MTAAAAHSAASGDAVASENDLVQSCDLCGTQRPHRSYTVNPTRILNTVPPLGRSNLTPGVKRNLNDSGRDDHHQSRATAGLRERDRKRDREREREREQLFKSVLERVVLPVEN